MSRLSAGAGSIALPAKDRVPVSLGECSWGLGSARKPLVATRCAPRRRCRSGADCGAQQAALSHAGI